MSYRTFANGEQIFGNGSYYAEWIEFIKSQGIEVDEDGCYEGDINDFMGALVTIENIVMRLNSARSAMIAERGNYCGKIRIPQIFDFTYVPTNIAENSKDQSEDCGNSLLDELFDVVEESYAFMPYFFYLACEEKLVADNCYAVPKHFHCFKLREGETIHVRAS